MQQTLADNYVYIVVGLAVVGLVFAAGRWVGHVNSDRASFKEFMKEVREKFDRIVERLPPPPIVSSESPVRLTDRGREISRKYGVEQWVSREVPRLMAGVRGKPDYEIHDQCMAHVRSLFGRDEALRNRMRAAAYESGIEVEQIQKIYAVELRDALLTNLEQPTPDRPTPP